MRRDQCIHVDNLCCPGYMHHVASIPLAGRLIRLKTRLCNNQNWQRNWNWVKPKNMGLTRATHGKWMFLFRAKAALTGNKKTLPGLSPFHDHLLCDLCSCKQGLIYLIYIYIYTHILWVMQSSRYFQWNIPLSHTPFSRLFGHCTARDQLLNAQARVLSGSDWMILPWKLERLESIAGNWDFHWCFWGFEPSQFGNFHGKQLCLNRVILVVPDSHTEPHTSGCTVTDMQGN